MKLYLETKDRVSNRRRAGREFGRTTINEQKRPIRALLTMTLPVREWHIGSNPLMGWADGEDEVVQGERRGEQERTKGKGEHQSWTSKANSFHDQKGGAGRKKRRARKNEREGEHRSWTSKANS